MVSHSPSTISLSARPFLAPPLFFSLLALLWTSSSSIIAADGLPEKPNIIYILADDPSAALREATA